MTSLDIINISERFPKKIKWLQDDEEKKWNKNRKSLGKDWLFYNANDIEYEHNIYGYRCGEFEDLKWKDSVLFFGCSNIYGKGNYTNDTIPSLYAKISGLPTINMGICGAGPDAINHNTIALIEKNYIPKKVVICWPEITRQMYYNGDDISSGKAPTFLGAWEFQIEKHSWATKGNKSRWQYFVASTEHYKTIAYLIQSSVINAWKLAGVPVYNYNFHYGKEHAKQELAVVYNSLPKGIDRARDCSHYGPKSNRLFAEYIDKYS